jgi:hypothetical protein
MNITPKPVEVSSLGKYKIKIRFSDGTEGIMELSELANKGVFKTWEENELFDKIYINKESMAIAWNEELEICPTSVYLGTITKW